MPWPPRRSRLSSAHARERAAIWPYAAWEIIISGVFALALARDTRGHLITATVVIVLSCLHFGSRDVAAVAGCGSKYLQR